MHQSRWFVQTGGLRCRRYEGVRNRKRSVGRVTELGAERRIVIVGGGLAGLAAAAALAQRRIPATLLESRARLGGRASSFHDAATNADVDNCQHVSMGCCTNFAHFVRTTGLANNFRRERKLFFIGPSGRVDEFAASNWPCPLHLAGAFRRLSYLSWPDKRAIARGLRTLAKAGDPALEDQAFSQWLSEHGQPQSAIDGFWQVVLVSALSESLDRISVPQARKVFVDGFLRHRDGWCVDIPTVPLQTLYGQQLIEWLTQRGVDVRLQSGVERLELDGARITAAVLRDGSRVGGEEFILAAPFFRAADLLPAELATNPVVRDFTRLESAPISSLHLWLDRPITDLPHAVLIGQLSQWLFNRTELSGSAAEGLPFRSHYYQIVISASRDLAGRSADDVQQAVLSELGEIWPAVRKATVLHRRLVTEHRAVFSVRPAPTGCVRRSNRRSGICNGPAIGRGPAGRPRWRGRSAADILRWKTSSNGWGGRSGCFSRICPRRSGRGGCSGFRDGVGSACA